MSREKDTQEPRPRKIPKGIGGRWKSFPFHHLIAIGLIAGVALVAYSNTFHAPFHFDDQPNILQNPNVQIN